MTPFLHQSVDTCRDAVARQPDLAYVYVNLASALGMAGDLVEADICCRRAMILQPGFAEAETTLGTDLALLGETTGGDECYERALSSCPELVEAHFNLAACPPRFGAVSTEPYEQFRQAIVLRPDYPEAWIGMSIALQSAEQPPGGGDLRPPRLGGSAQRRARLEAFGRRAPKDGRAKRRSALCRIVPASPSARCPCPAATANVDVCRSFRIVPACGRCPRRFRPGIGQLARLIRQPDRRDAMATVICARAAFFLGLPLRQSRERLSRYGSVVAETIGGTMETASAPYSATAGTHFARCRQFARPAPFGVGRRAARASGPSGPRSFQSHIVAPGANVRTRRPRKRKAWWIAFTAIISSLPAP